MLTQLEKDLIKEILALQMPPFIESTMTEEDKDTVIFGTEEEKKEVISRYIVEFKKPEKESELVNAQETVANIPIIQNEISALEDIIIVN